MNITTDRFTQTTRLKLVVAILDALSTATATDVSTPSFPVLWRKLPAYIPRVVRCCEMESRQADPTMYLILFLDSVTTLKSIFCVIWLQASVIVALQNNWVCTFSRLWFVPIFITLQQHFRVFLSGIRDRRNTSFLTSIRHLSGLGSH